MSFTSGSCIQIKYTFFDEIEEMRSIPLPLSRLDASKEVNHIQMSYKLKKQKNIFFTLPYWKHDLLHYNVDIMHIQKICVIVSMVLTWTHIDEYKVLTLPKKCRRTDKLLLPIASLNMNKKKGIILQGLEILKVLDGFASNISMHAN